MENRATRHVLQQTVGMLPDGSTQSNHEDDATASSNTSRMPNHEKHDLSQI